MNAMISPIISTIIPVYNVGRYLEQSIVSVLEQSIGFEKKIQIILVDDGSTDNSDEICKKFLIKYPDNIVYVSQKNKGVSAARNLGMSLAKGEYIHFLDADDIISKNTYEQSIKFLEENNNKINFVAIKINFFDEIIDEHPLNYKFKKNRIIDLCIEPNNPLMHVITCIFIRSSLYNVKFDEALSITEDAKFLSDILLDKKAYGVLSDPIYFYRKRGDGTSAIGGRKSNKNYYTEVPSRVYEHMLNTWRVKGLNTVTFAQYVILYDLSYRLEQKSSDVLSEIESGQYKDVIKRIISRLDDEAILKSDLTIYKKIYLLKTKYGADYEKRLIFQNESYLFNDILLIKTKMINVYIDFIHNMGGGKFKLEGYLNQSQLAKDAAYCIDVSGVKFKIKAVERKQLIKTFLGDTLYDGGAFEVYIDIDTSKKQIITAELVIGDQYYNLSINAGPYTGLTALKMSYRKMGNLLLSNGNRALTVQPYNRKKRIFLELRYLIQILVNWRLRSAYLQFKKFRSRNLRQLPLKGKLFELFKPIFIIIEAVVMIPRAILLRCCYYIFNNLIKKKPIWIISDRGMAAGDNGEALFRYISTQENVPADVYFVISKKSKDFKRLSKYGDVLDQNSLKYKLLFLCCDKIISSQADVETTNPFIRQVDHYLDLFSFDFIFLQHGIIRHDLSSWLNRFNKNIKLFITSAEKEYNSILSNPYYYSSRNVLLSGLPRYDLLHSEPKSKLILAPTYRKNLAKQKTDKNGVRKYDNSFKKSEYFMFYNKLINDKRIKVALNAKGMVGEFYLHPAFSSQINDFESNKKFTIMNFPYNYSTAFKEGNILISDHSSVVFDFAYLKKPVIYAYFDVNTFFDNHTYDKSDFFSDETDGFGPIYYNYESLVNGVIELINSNQKMRMEYKENVDKFFFKTDKNNSQRVYKAILNLSEKGSI